MSDVFWLSAQQFRRLQPLLPTDTRGVARVDDRRVISGIVHVLSLTPYECICKVWARLPNRFRLDPIHQLPGLNSYWR